MIFPKIRPKGQTTGAKDRSSLMTESLSGHKAGKEEKLLSLLGFAARARKLIAGTDLTRDGVRRGSVIIAVVAGDASENTKKRITDAGSYYETDVVLTGISSAEIGHRIGKPGAAAVVGVTDMNFANGIAALTDEQ